MNARRLRQILIAPDEGVIDEVASNSPAALAGLTNGDEIIALNGQKIYSPLAVFSAEDAMSNSPVKPLTLTIKRGGTSNLTARCSPQNRFNRRTARLRSASSPGARKRTNHAVIRIRWNKSNRASGRSPARSTRCSRSKSEIGVQQLGGAVMIIRVYSNLFQRRGRLAARAVVQRHPECEPRVAQPAAAAGAGWRAHHAFAHRSRPPPTGERQILNTSRPALPRC
jgi:membrane-associated protease RseP (regulator of RpoE activity)